MEVLPPSFRRMIHWSVCSGSHNEDALLELVQLVLLLLQQPSPSHQHFYRWHIETIPRKMGGLFMALFDPQYLDLQKLNIYQGSLGEIIPNQVGPSQVLGFESPSSSLHF